MKWRVLLALAGVAVALILWRIALCEQLSMIQEANHGRHFHTPPALAISYSLNAPSVVLSGFIHNFSVQEFHWTETWIHYGPIEYYVFVFALWWGVGWRLDRRSPARKSVILRSVGCFAGIVFAIALVFAGVILPGSAYGTIAVPISMLLWGLGLLVHFGIELRRLCVPIVRQRV